MPDGVEVELGGFDLMGDRELRLAPVPRVPGTPLIRVKAYTLMGDVKVRSSSADRAGAGLAALAARGGVAGGAAAPQLPPAPPPPPDAGIRGDPSEREAARRGATRGQL